MSKSRERVRRYRERAKTLQEKDKALQEADAIRKLLPPGYTERDVYLYVVAQRLEREHPGLLEGLKRGFGGKQIRDLDTGAMLPLAHQVRVGVYGPRLSELLAYARIR